MAVLWGARSRNIYQDMLWLLHAVRLALNMLTTFVPQAVRDIHANISLALVSASNNASTSASVL